MKASQMIKLAESYLGCRLGDEKHKEIVDRYNSYEPLPKGYKLKYDDAWCAAFVSSLAIQLEYDDFPVECSCPRMIKELMRLGYWVEDDAYYPNVGDLIFYDWQDSGKGDNKSEPDHVGIVQKVIGDQIYVIEGNYRDVVNIRTIQVNGRYIRGFGKLPYEDELKVGQKIEFNHYSYKGEKVDAYARGVIIYILDDAYVVEHHGRIVFVKKEEME